MVDSTSAPPVAPSAGSPELPPDEERARFFENLKKTDEFEQHQRMSRYVPPVMQPEFLDKNPPPPAVTTPPVDMEDVRQAEAKRGPAAPNEPKEYIDAQGAPLDPKVLPEPAPPPVASAPEPAPASEPAPTYPSSEPQP